MITCKSLGRLGRFANQAFQICGVLGIATKNGHPYCFPKWVNWDHLERFGSNEPIDVFNYFENELPAYAELNYQYRWCDWGYHDIRLGDGAYDLAGHFQSPKYFAHCMDLVRHYMRMKNEPEQNDYVAIHWRAGDYQEGKDDVYHPRCTMEYYNEAMKHFPGEMFLVFTDDYDRATEMFGAKVQYAKAGDYLQEFRLMKRCKSFITANSSYSLMAAILGEHPDKKVVCPKRWFGAVAGISGADCYPENAIVI